LPEVFPSDVLLPVGEIGNTVNKPKVVPNTAPVKIGPVILPGIFIVTHPYTLKVQIVFIRTLAKVF